MAFKTAGSGGGLKVNIIKPEQLGVGKEILGFYAKNFKIQTQSGESMVHVFYRESDMKQFALFGTQILDDKMSEVPIGAAVKFTYLGKPSGKRYHAFNVDYDDEDIKPLDQINEMLELTAAELEDKEQPVKAELTPEETNEAIAQF